MDTRGRVRVSRSLRPFDRGLPRDEAEEVQRMKRLPDSSDDRPSAEKDSRKEQAEFLTIDDWAIRLQLSKRTIFRMIDEGIVPKCDFAVGKTRRWHVSTYDAWVACRIARN